MSDSQPRNTVLLVLVDAFSQVYLSNKYTPFLCSLAEDGISRTLDPLFVFRGIETTLFTGVWPSVHNVWTEFKLAQNTRNSRKDHLLQQIIRSLQVLPTDELRAKSRYFVERYLFQSYYKTLNLVPPAAMPYFETSQSKETAQKEAVGNVRTLFDVFRDTDIQYRLIEPWIRGDKGVLDKAKKMINQNRRCDFWYVKFSHLDHLGHRFGPHPSRFKSQLNKVDGYVEQIVTLLKRGKGRLQVMILGDHGMSQVTKTENILEDLYQLESKLYQDYLVFADSTMIRFWFFTEKAIREIPDFLQQIKCGHILSTTEKKLLKIPLDPKYGEAIYVVDEGHLIHPSFFHSRSEPKGMHGYAYPKTPEAFPILIMDGEMAAVSPKDRRIRFIDVPHLVLRSLLPDIGQADFGLSSYVD